nr:aryl-sulfate sulfotransferase [Alkalibacillus almallahensis]
MIEKDPYNFSPLSALALFQTDEAAEVTVIVEGKDGAKDIEKTISGSRTEHEIPILGLYPDATNQVILQAETESGETMKHEFEVETSSLPDDLIQPTIEESHPENMQDGLTFVVPSKKYPYAVDENAQVRWYSSMQSQHLFKRLENGHILLAPKNKEENGELVVMDMLGDIQDSYNVEVENYENNDIIHHDTIELPNGNLLATVHDGAEYIEDEMIEIDRETGETVNVVDMKEVMPSSFYEDYSGPGIENGEVDWFHQNAVSYDEKDDAILVSSRSQDIVVKMDYPDGDIKWILGSHENWPSSYEQYLLEPESEDMKFPGAQHAMTTLPDQDQNDATSDVLLFDNNKVITRGDEGKSEEFSQAVQYRINEEDHTVEQVWSYGKERGEEFFSFIIGDADHLPDDGNRLITSGYMLNSEDERESRIVEVTGSNDPEVVFEILLTGFTEDANNKAYRAERMPLYPQNQANPSIFQR